MSKLEPLTAAAASDGDLEAGLGKVVGRDKALGGGGKDVVFASGELEAKRVIAEDPRLRWAFVRKVYSILAVQFAFTAAVAAVTCFVRPIPAFLLSNTPAAWGVFIAVLVLPLVAMWPMLRYRERHPVNLVLLGLFTLCVSLSVGMASATVGARRGYDFTFLFPFLFVCLVVLLVFLIIQICFPLGRVGMTVYGCLATIVFSGFIIYDTNLLIKRHSYSEYVYAAISLYLDVINLFMAQLSLSA